MRVVTLLMASMLLLGACNTFKGVGQDVQGAGEAIEKGAEKTQEKIE
jgi:predicted small secreted protein